MARADGPTGVGRTALGMALVRARESRRDDRLFDDPFASAFLAAAPDAFGSTADALRGDDTSWGARIGSHAVLRTRFYDDYLLDAVSHGLRQVVLLAAGLDSRAYRLVWPGGIRLFEVDLPDVLSFKQRVLDELDATARCDRHSSPADLTGDWTTTLLATGFAPTEPTAWLLEGLLAYLPADEVVRVLTAVGRLSAADSRAAFEAGSATWAAGEADSMPALAPYRTLWRGGLPDAAGWLAAHGWRTEQHDRAAVAARFGRHAADGAAFVTAVCS